MERDDIEKAATQHANMIGWDHDPEETRGLFAYSFEKGADWRINSVWHDVKELPENNTWFLAQIGNDCFDTFTMRVESDRWKQWCKGMNIIRWSYIKDLLPNMED
jgi:hypothetical protein